MTPKAAKCINHGGHIDSSSSSFLRLEQRERQGSAGKEVKLHITEGVEGRRGKEEERRQGSSPPMEGSKTDLEQVVEEQAAALAKLEKKMERIIGQANLLMISDAEQNERLGHHDVMQVGKQVLNQGLMFLFSPIFTICLQLMLLSHLRAM